MVFLSPAWSEVEGIEVGSYSCTSIASHLGRLLIWMLGASKILQSGFYSLRGIIEPEKYGMVVRDR